MDMKYQEASLERFKYKVSIPGDWKKSADAVSWCSKNIGPGARRIGPPYSYRTEVHLLTKWLWTRASESSALFWFEDEDASTQFVLMWS